MWKTDPVDIASDILTRISTYDSTAPAPSDAVLFQWAEMITRAAVSHEHLAEGVLRVYEGGGDPPRNKIGAVIQEAREARKIARQGQEVRALSSAAPSGPSGYAIPAAYEVDNVLSLPCEQCGVPSGEWCEMDGEIKKIPHTVRLARAYRENNPKGRRRHEERQAHLGHHRRTFVPKWGN